MPKLALNLKNIADVRGGLIDAMFNKALQRMVDDIEAAPDIAEFREVNLQVCGKPKYENGELVDVTVEFRVKGKVPIRVASSVMSVSGSGRTRQLVFALDSDDNPDQMTFHDLPEAERE